MNTKPRTIFVSKLTENVVSQAPKIIWMSDKRKSVEYDDNMEDPKRLKNSSSSSTSNKKELNWDSFYNTLLEYGKIHGDYNVKIFVEGFDKNYAVLHHWLTLQRRHYKAGKLRQDHLTKLQILADEGKFLWQEAVEPFAPSEGQNSSSNSIPEFELFFDALLMYGEEHGHCNVPLGFKIFIDDVEYDLGFWLSVQRDLYSKQALSEADTSKLLILSSENRFLFDMPDDYIPPPINIQNIHLLWYSKYEAVKVFINQHGNCNIDQEGITISCSNDMKFDLGIWVRTQRKRKMANRMPVEYQKKLDILAQNGQFSWLSLEDIKALQEENELREKEEEILWNAWYNVLVWYGKHAGHCNLSIQDTVGLPDGSAAELGKWLSRQKFAVKNRKLKLERLEKLIVLVDEGKLSQEWKELTKTYQRELLLNSKSENLGFDELASNS